MSTSLLYVASWGPILIGLRRFAGWAIVSKNRVWGRLFPVLVTYFVDSFGLAIVYPLLTPLLLDPKYQLLGHGFSSGNRVFILSLLIASFPLAQFFGAPMIGALSDRLGRRRIFLLTITGAIFGYAITAMGAGFQSLSLLWGGRVISGLFAGNLSLCLAVIADMAEDPGTRARYFGWIGALGGPSFISAIFVGGALINYPAIPFAITAVLASFNLWLMASLFKETHYSHFKEPFTFFAGIRNIKTALQFQKVRRIYGSFFFFSLCWVTSMQLLSSYANLRFSATPTQLTIAFSAVAIFWFLSNSVLNPWLTRRAPPAALFSAALVLLGLFLLISVAMKNFYLFLPFFALVALLSALSWTNGLATISLTAPPSIQGSILGINQSVSALASIIGPLVGGALIAFDPGALLLFTGFCSWVAAFFLRKRR
jgi:DHA1 family tetracycline resistance protein-like MFS transporter